ncbi:hypothetical protein [Streptomyces sp. NPDC051014]|uniref:hypothetical protein n=1 Tax=Streptomyces sp. NPDC051014 TaxID=3155751 RepID=UPI0033E4CF66
MSDDVLSIFPSDPKWLPGKEAADRLASLVERLAPGVPGGMDVEIEVSWHDVVTLVDCGQNLERIGCPLCEGEVATEFWVGLMEKRHEEGFADLAVEVPCCGGTTTLDALDYDWPCGFARFEIAVWNPDRVWFSDDELVLLGDQLGHPVRQVRAHI